MKYKLSKKAWESIGKQAGWVQAAGINYVEEETLEDTWSVIMDWHWPEISKAIVSILSEGQLKSLVQNSILDLEPFGFTARTIGEFSSENLDWFDVEVHDFEKFRAFLNSASPEFVQKLEASAKEMAEDDSISWDFKLGDQ